MNFPIVIKNINIYSTNMRFFLEEDDIEEEEPVDESEEIE